ncbi:MAG: ATP-binding cassette domain-containing protein [Blautia sp.]|uniref:ATP-binding cassette domain-containing protein n=1 Tax=Blautia sp. TaxID=1955243 RepID=UPI002E75B554|nr:ATP-binding cassette domain-containing protein [Blautia sp.]MEE1444541.1 ATP-binding cassette domain-containing protein [Blautia sp.]
MENSAILVEHVTKKFGTETVLEDVCLRVKQGSICGIVGRNGSGKTVLFKCICGLLHTNSGNIQVDRAQIGAIIEEPGFLKQYSGKKNLKLLASLSDKPHKDFDELLALVGLSSAGQKRVGKYSMGMKQRLGIAQAIMENQQILILDEPMNGLDNQGVQEIRDLFLKLQEEGKTILLASHNREDIDVLCDEVYEMDHGHLQVLPK